MKFFKCSVFFLTVIILILFIAPFFISWNGYCRSLIMHALENSNYKLESLGKVRVRLLFPKITIQTLKLQHVDYEKDLTSGIVFIEKLDLYPFLISMMTHAPKISKIIVDSPVLSYKIFTDLMKFEYKRNFLNSITIFNAIFESSKPDDSNVYDKIFYLDNASIKIGSVKQKVTGKMVIRKNEYNFSIIKNMQKQGNYSLTSKLSSVSNKMIYSGNKENGQFSGTMDIKSNDFSDLTQDFSVLTKMPLLKFIKSKENFSLTSKILFSDTNFQIHDFAVKAASLNGGGEMSCKTGEICNVNFKFSEINLDSLIDINNFTNPNDKITLIDKFNILLPDSLKMNLEIFGKEIIYRGQKSSNFHVNAFFLKGKINVEDLTIDLPGMDNVMNVKGIVTSDYVRSRFDGVMLVKGSDLDTLTEWIAPIKVDSNLKQKTEFSLKSGIYIAPRIFSLSNFTIKIEDGDIRGNIVIKRSGKKKYANSDIYLSGMNLNKYSVHNLKTQDDVVPMKWLREIDYDITLNLSGYNFQIFDEYVENMTSTIKISKKDFELTKISFTGKNGDNLEGNIKISVDDKNIKPNLFVKLKSNKYNARLINFPSARQVLKTPSGKVNELKWSDKKIHFFNLQNFNGKINLEVDSLIVEDGNNIREFNFQANLQDSLLLVDKLSFKHKGGDFNMNARLALTNKSSLTAVFTASCLDLQDILRITLGINVIKGTASLSGSLKTQGDTALEWINGLEGEVDLAAVNIIVDGISIDEFIRNLLSSKNRSEIAYLTKIGLYKGTTEINNIESKATINNGNAVVSSQFIMDRISSSFAASISLPKSVVDSIFRLFFIHPKTHLQSYIDMGVQGVIWNPKINFNVDDLYSVVSAGK